MISTRTNQPSDSVAAGREAKTSHIDPLLSSIFLAAAALIVAFQDPINVAFEPNVTVTLVPVVVGILLLVWANIRPNPWVLYGGAVILLLTILVAAFSQPVQLNLSVLSVLPMRLALVLLVAIAWAFLLRPPDWARRALLAFAIPTAVVLAVVGGPTAAAQLFNITTARPLYSNNFAPYWMALDSHGNLYATDLDGMELWVFNSKGDPQGTLSPGLAPAVGTPGPGIVPAGLETSSSLTSLGIYLTPTIGPIAAGTAVPRTAISNFDFCGLAIDPQDNIYVLDLYDPAGNKILRFDTNGDITGRWDTPKGYQPTSGCIAADADHIYLSGVDGTILALDHNMNVQQQVKVPFQPFGIEMTSMTGSNGGKTLLVLGAGQLEHVSVGASDIVTKSVTLPATSMQAPMLYTQDGELILADHQAIQLVRVDPNTGQVLGTIGGPGPWAGQFADLGGMAQDKAGHIYVADYPHRVIQRFTPDGKINAIWWAPELNGHGEID